MTVDVFFSTIAKVAGWILPVAGVVVLIYVVLVLKELLQTLKNLTKTLDTAEHQIRKLDAPLSTAENISHTIDEVHDSTKKAVKSVVSGISENIDLLKQKINDMRDSADVVPESTETED